MGQINLQRKHKGHAHIMPCPCTCITWKRDALLLERGVSALRGVGLLCRLDAHRVLSGDGDETRGS